MCFGGFPGGSAVQGLLAMWETWAQSPGPEDPLEQQVQPTPVFLPGRSQAAPWGHKGSDTTQQLNHNNICIFKCLYSSSFFSTSVFTECRIWGLTFFPMSRNITSGDVLSGPVCFSLEVGHHFYCHAPVNTWHFSLVIFIIFSLSLAFCGLIQLSILYF